MITSDPYRPGLFTATWLHLRHIQTINLWVSTLYRLCLLWTPSSCLTGKVDNIKKTNCTCVSVFYISLVWSQLLYCSQVWWPNLIQDVAILEFIWEPQNSYIPNDYTSSYRTRLSKLSMLELWQYLSCCVSLL